MAHAFINIVAPIQLKDVARLRMVIARLMDNPANPATVKAFAVMNKEEGIHFASLHALLGSDAKRGHLYMELSADGDGDEVIRRLAHSGESLLEPIFSEAIDWRNGNDLADYLVRHRVYSGFTLLDHTGVDHAGTPGMSVGRIRREAKLRRHVELLLAEESVSARPMEQLRSVRAKLMSDKKWAWALNAPEPVDRTNTIFVGGIARTSNLIWSFAKAYLWAFLFPILIWGLMEAQDETGWRMRLLALAFTALKGVAIALLIGGLAVLLLYLLLLRNEKRDWTSERVISRSELAEILKRENHYTQNHMISHTTLKPGFMRRCVVKLALFAIGTLTPLNGRPGFLNKIGTIHFARWILLPGTRDYIFVSNYDGSWESYLEDFITKSHEGLTAAWSCSLGFPKTRGLFNEGATDGERFKRFARHSMIHTPFWYSAYPDISTDQIRTNAKIRRGIALAESDEEAGAMLSLFGSVVRPVEKLETNQIQTLVFGGLGMMPFGQCMLIELPEDKEKARAWLAGVKRHVAFSDGRNIETAWVVSLAFAPKGLAKLGLPNHALETFPAAFLDGMTAPGRERILGDPDAKERKKSWWWGQSTPDVALLVYARTQEAVGDAQGAIDALGVKAFHIIPLQKVAKKDQDRTEPFGFVDGISQPIIKGTFKATKDPNRLNLVEPGELILGYPDNRGNLPPIPRMRARRDPDRILPIGNGGWDFDAAIEVEDRDIGRNGSFLVIRQLEQHVDAFANYCEEAAQNIHRDQSPGYIMTAEHVAAKMVGRWKDGSPLVRWPYESESSFRADMNDADPAMIRAGQVPGISINPSNDFRYGTEDPQALRCPFGSHIRRTNPRDSQLPGDEDEIDISNRHRILRIGRPYQPAEGQDPGILFMCLNGDIERQFEFIQQTWANSGHFHGLDGETDPLITTNAKDGHFTIPTRNGPIRLEKLPNFVTTRGGGYFFLAGRKLIEYLAQA